LLLRLVREVGRHTRKYALDLRLGALVARHDTLDRLRPCGDLIDVAWSNLATSSSARGTICIMVSALLITPPTVCIAS
jgi:hypothetical protein